MFETTALTIQVVYEAKSLMVATTTYSQGIDLDIQDFDTSLSFKNGLRLHVTVKICLLKKCTFLFQTVHLIETVNKMLWNINIVYIG